MWGEIGEGLYVVLTTDAAPMTRGTAAGKLLAEDLCGMDSEELRIMKSTLTLTSEPSLLQGRHALAARDSGEVRHTASTIASNVSSGTGSRSSSSASM